MNAVVYYITRSDRLGRDRRVTHTGFARRTPVTV